MRLEILLPLLLVVFTASMILYFKLADKYNIIDKPNERSSHTTITLRGGGVLFPLSFLFYGIYTGFQDIPLLIVSVLLVSVISFWDDIQSLPSYVRLLIQASAMSLLFYQVGLFEEAIFVIVLSFIIAVGLINAYNFMDGINGITVLNSFVVAVTILVLMPEGERLPLYFLIPSLIVFGFFNVRKKAKCFAGDIGSVSLGYIVTYYMFVLFLKGYDIQYVLLLGVYGVDSILTISQRLIQKENIFKPHRKHLYQYFVHTKKWSHLLTSIAFALVQAGVSAVLITNVKMAFIQGYQLTLIVLGVLIFFYLLLKMPLIRKSDAV